MLTKIPRNPGKLKITATKITKVVFLLQEDTPTNIFVEMIATKTTEIDGTAIYILRKTRQGICLYLYGRGSSGVHKIWSK